MKSDELNLTNIFELLESAGLDVVSLNVLRLQAAEQPLTDEVELLEEAIRRLLQRVAKVEVKAQLLADEFDSLRLKYAELQGHNNTIQHKLSHAAKKYGNPDLQGLVRDMRAAPKSEVLQSLPSGRAILKALEAGL